jgi:hypothetical protein
LSCALVIQGSSLFDIDLTPFFVIPAQAGIHPDRGASVDFRLCGNDEEEEPCALS